jgi:hypothetical protein
MLIHIFLKFSLLYENTIWWFLLLFLRDLAVCMKTKKNIFLMFQWKPGILILDLYLYGIKIKTNIKKNSILYAEKSQTFENIF